MQTPMGQLSLQSALALPKGGSLVLQLQSQSPFVQFQISSLNGSPPPLSARALKTPAASSPAQGSGSAAAATSSGATAGQAAAASAPKLTPGNVLQATLMRPLSNPQGGGALQTPGHLTSAVTGTVEMQANKNMKGILPSQSPKSGIGQPSVKSPVSGNVASTSGGRATAGAINPNVAKGAPSIASQASGYLPTGSQLSVKITGLQLPNPATTSPAPTPATSTTGTGLAAGTSISGTVTGSTPSGHPIVQTKAGVFSLTTQTVVPRGSEVTLEVVNAPSPPLQKPGTPPPLHQTLFTSRQWPALEEIVQVIQETNPAAAQQIVNSFVPQPTATLSAAVLFFLSALRGGELRGWLGDDTLRLVEKARPNLIGRISDDFTSLARMADEPAGSDWRVALIPINTGAELEQIRLLLRRHANEEEEEDAGKSDTRFVIDVELSKFGRIQMDGLVRNKGKSLDLIVRSQDPFPESMNDDIRTIFQDAADLTGLKGSVSFQAAPPDFIDIPDPSGDHDLGLVV